eukprot:3931121-Prymnesium_polylepis.1
MSARVAALQLTVRPATEIFHPAACVFLRGAAACACGESSSSVETRRLVVTTSIHSIAWILRPSTCASRRGAAQFAIYVFPGSSRPAVAPAPGRKGRPLHHSCIME